MYSHQLNDTEYNPFYHNYIQLAGDEQLLEQLELGLDKTISFFENLPKEKWDYRYAEGKWTPKEVLLHLIDTERVFAYRALQFARALDCNLEGFDQDIFVENSNATFMDVKELLKDYKANRRATFRLFKSFSDQELEKKGTANNSNMSVRAAAFIICGHEKHHISIIKERYL